MPKIHITLVGGQPAPVYHGIVATQPDKVIFIYSEGSRDVLTTLRRELSIPEDKQEPLDPTDPMKIISRAEYLAEKYRNDEITVNISSGLKSWSHLFGIVFDKIPNAAIVYMDQNNVLWNYRTMQSQSGFNFDMHTLFRLYGNPLKNNYKRFSDYTDSDKKVIQKIENIRRFNYKSFNKLTTVLENKQKDILRSQKDSCFDLPDSSYIRWVKKGSKGTNDFVEICLYKNGNSKLIKLESPNAVSLTFNSGWFEYKVALLLSTWDKAKEICLNCHFPSKQNIDKNETDIIVNTGTKILFVECKTQINRITDIDKFRSVVKGYGGTGSKGLFITDAKISDTAIEKCKENDIIHFSLEDGKQWGLSSEKALQLLLDNELLNINTK